MEQPGGFNIAVLAPSFLSGQDRCGILGHLEHLQQGALGTFEVRLPTSLALFPLPKKEGASTGIFFRITQLNKVCEGNLHVTWGYAVFC